MAASNYDACESRLLVHEGSRYTDGVHPYDPGGPTRWGITLEDARLHWKKAATADDVRTMPVEIAKGIYRSKYWDALNCDGLPAGIDDSIFDYGVNSGIGRSGKVLRRVIGFPDDDWHVTSPVLLVLKSRDPKAVINAINDERLKFLQTLAIWPTYKGGWTTRVTEERAFSIQLASGTAPALPAPSLGVQVSGKGAVPKPNTAPVAKAGTAAVVASSGLAHWFGAHPAVTFALLAAGATFVLFIISRIHASHQAQQEAPTPGIVPVPAA